MSILSIQEAARELSEAFETKKRDNGDTFVCLREGSPQWMTDVIHAVHGDKLPDDTVYLLIEKCANAIADNLDDDPSDSIMSIEPDSYTHDLTAWLHARADHIYYLTEVLEDLGADIKDGFQLLAYAQQKQIQEVGNALISALEGTE